MKASGTVYDQIGSGYNATRQADPYIAERLFQLLGPTGGGVYLDIGCGTGNYTLALADKGIRFYGVEPSNKMLDVARSRSSDITWVEGVAGRLPFKDAHFDGAIATLTIHHWKDLHKGFGELYRVLKSNTRLVIFTATPEQMQGYWLNYYFPAMMESSIRQMPSFETVSDALTTAGFVLAGTEKYNIQDDLQDLFLYAGKNKPELYFDENIRAGISSFSALANAAEVERGLMQLRGDIDSGRFNCIRSKFANSPGDYLFLTAKKC